MFEVCLVIIPITISEGKRLELVEPVADTRAKEGSKADDSLPVIDSCPVFVLLSFWRIFAKLFVFK